MEGYVEVMLAYGYSLSCGSQGFRPCSTDHGEAAGPVWPAVDCVLSFVITERSTFALLAASSGHRAVPCQGGDGTFDIINDSLIYAKPSCVVTPRSACNDFQANSELLGASTIMDCTQVHAA